MSIEVDIKKLSNLSKIEVSEDETYKTKEKIIQIIKFFDKLDEFVLDNSSNPDHNKDNDKVEIKFESLREDEQTATSKENEYLKNKFEFKFLHHRNGYVLGPKI